MTIEVIFKSGNTRTVASRFLQILGIRGRVWRVKDLCIFIIVLVEVYAIQDSSLEASEACKELGRVPS